MVAAKDNMDTRMVALISLVGVLFLAFIIIATDAAYSWSETLVAQGKEAGASPEGEAARAAWDKEAKSSPQWIKAGGLPAKKYMRIPMERACELVLKDYNK